MRKFFALALAVAMVLSLASVAFAADPNKTATVVLDGPYRYHSDSNGMRSVLPGTAATATAPNKSEDVNRYGEGTYFAILIEDDDTTTVPDGEGAVPVSAYKEVEKLKVKTDFEMGEDLVESVSIVKKYVQNVTSADYIFTEGALYDEDAGESYPDGYYYFVEFKVAKKQTTADADVVATLEFNRKADKDVKSATGSTVGIGKIDDVEIDVEFNVFYADAYVKNGTFTDFYVTKDVELKYDTDYALKFDCDDEVELSFGDEDHDGTNEGTFTVDLSGQGKLFLRYNTTADEAIAAANPGAKLYFLNFNNVKFNRVGEFVYEMDDIAAAYKVVDGQLVEIKGLELDSDSATFNTRVLESYVFADTELVNPAPAAAVDAPAAADVTNPTTGAAA